MPQLDQSSHLFNRSRRFDRQLLGAFFTFALLLLVPGSLRAENDLSRLIDDAKRDFKPVTKEDVEDARNELEHRMIDVERYVEPFTQNGRQWLHYLRWDALDDALREDRPKLAPFDETLRQVNKNQEGLENRRFRRFARALRRYRDTLAVSMWDRPSEIYNKQLDAVQRDIETYRKERSPRNETALSERIRVIDSIGQAPRLVRALRDELARPNAFVDISTDLISASSEKINRTQAITDCILGTNIHGTAHTRGRVEVVTVPNDDKAVLLFNSKGHTVSQNTGFNGPAVIGSTSNTDFTAKKRVEMTDEAFVTGSAKANATTHLDIHSVSKNGGGLGSRLVSRIGWKRAQQSRGQAESISANHAETRVEGQFNDELNDEVQKLRDRYVDEYRRPLERRDEVPDYIRFSSDRSSIRFETAQASRSQLGATDAPPPAREEHDVVMRLHETAVDNYSASILGGATARQTKPDEDVKFNVELPKWMKDMWKKRKTEPTNDASGKQEPFKEYAMTLREDRPISVGFERDRVKLTVHMTHLKSGEKTFDNWDVTGTYTPELSEGKVLLHREGNLTMLPADFRGQLNSRQVAERRNLEEELNRRSAQGQGFPKTIEFEPVKPSGKLAEAGPLEFRSFTPGDGWLSIGLDREGVRTR
jgi:hypothetical protein